MVSSAPDRRMLSEIAAAVGVRQRVRHVGDDVAVSDVHMDSRHVSPGSLYTAIRGARVDGHRFIDQAVTAGAVAVAVEEPPAIQIPYLLLDDSRAALGWMAAEVHDYPARELGTIGITGTNGKTTVAHMLAALAGDPDGDMAVIGTVGANLDGIGDSPRTTPEASTLQRILRRLVEQGVARVAIEVSSHAMEMGRVNGTVFDVVAFTNLSQDHLDYHHTMEEYAAVKRRLFTELLPESPKADRFAVINIDDPEGDRIAEDCPLDVVTYGHRRDADVSIVWDARGADGSDIGLRVFGIEREVRTPLLGAANVMNAAAAVAWAHRAGHSPEVIWLGLNACRRIPGRLEAVWVTPAQPFQVLVDYSHTPESLRGALRECRALAGEGRVLVIFGCGGDRDTTKRAPMGEIAGTLADEVWLTNDNPRTEDPERIADMAMEGLRRTPLGGQHIHRVLDRAEAIHAALGAAEPGDVVLIAGKGHETYQEIGEQRFDFDDARVAREWLTGHLET